MVDIKFNSKYRILYVTFSGVVGFDDLELYMHKIRGLREDYQFLDVIHDMREIEYKLQPEKIGDLLKTAKDVASKFSFLRVASVHQNAHSTAISTIIRERLEIKNVEYKVYSTIEAAFDWLKVKKINQQVG